MKANEQPADFLSRLKVKAKRSPAPFPEIIVAVEGQLALAALYYGVDEGFLKDLVLSDRGCRDAFEMARAARMAKEKKGREVGEAMFQKARGEVAASTDLPRRSNWPADETSRLEAYRAWILETKALRLYEGDLARLHEGSSIPMDVLIEMVRDDEAIANEREIGNLIAAEVARSRLAVIGKTSNQPSAMIKILQAYEPSGAFRDRSQVDVRRVGFEPPADADRDEDGELASVLPMRRVK